MTWCAIAFRMHVSHGQWKRDTLSWLSVCVFQAPDHTCMPRLFPRLPVQSSCDCYEAHLALSVLCCTAAGPRPNTKLRPPLIFSMQLVAQVQSLGSSVISARAPKYVGNGVEASATNLSGSALSPQPIRTRSRLEDVEPNYKPLALVMILEARDCGCSSCHWKISSNDRPTSAFNRVNCMARLYRVGSKRCVLSNMSISKKPPPKIYIMNRKKCYATPPKAPLL